MTARKKSGHKVPAKSSNRARKAAGTVKKPAENNKKKQIKKPANGKHPGGRPSKYNAEYHPKIARYLGQLGKTDKEISAELGISEVTLNAWKNDHQEFLKSLKEGKEHIDDLVENALLKRALGFTYDEVKTVRSDLGAERTETTKKQIVPDVTAQIFWLCNRRSDRWKNVNRVEHSGPGGSPVPVSAVDIEKILGTEGYREYERKVFNTLSAKPADARS